MKVTIHYNGRYEDNLIFYADSLENAREIAFSECEKRSWEPENCWSEVEE